MLLHGYIEPSRVEVLQVLCFVLVELREAIAVTPLPAVGEEGADGVPFGKRWIASFLLFVYFGRQIRREHFKDFGRFAGETRGYEGVRQILGSEGSVAVDEGLLGSSRAGRHDLDEALLNIFAAGFRFEG